MVRVNYKDFYDGRFVQFHYKNDERIFKIVKVDDEFLSYYLADENSDLRFKIEKRYYERPSNHGLWETDTTIKLNRENRLNELLNYGLEKYN